MPGKEVLLENLYLPSGETALVSTPSTACTHFQRKEVCLLQEEVEQRTVTLAVSTSKMTANVLKSAISKYLAYRKEKKREGPVKPCGKQSVKQLVGQDQGVSNIEITDKNIKDFERIARKYGVDFALKKDKTGDIPKYLVFFKARDADALTAAFKEYTAKTDRKKERPSVLKKLRKFKEVAADIDTPKVRKKELDAR